MSARNSAQPIAVEIISTSTKNARQVIGCGNTRLYELLNSGKIQSYTDGRSRKVIVASLREYVARQLEAETSKERTAWTAQATKARMAKRQAARPTRG
jgi:hypothetical protein